MSSCAIFDLDGTIIDYSSEGVFLKYLLKEGELPMSNLLDWTSYFLKTQDLRRAKAYNMYLHGLDYQRVCNLAESCFKERLVDRISPRVSDLMAFHRSEGRTIVILSGSLQVLVYWFHNYLESDLMIGYELETVDGYITGHQVGLNPHAENKAVLVKELTKTHAFNLADSYAYGNHHSDVHKLRLVGHPVAVNPDRKLRRIAMENGWQIEQFHVKT